MEDQHSQNFKASETRRQNSGKKEKEKKSHFRNGDETRSSTRDAIARETEGVKRKISRMKTKLTRDNKDLRKSDQY